MRIAVSGTHRVGKTTLVDDLQRALPGYDAVDEPYRQLEDEGHLFSVPPTIEEFEQQLERAILSVEDGGGDCLFDRCPADLLAYLAAHDDADSVSLDRWVERATPAMRRLDLIVFVAIDDRIPVGRDDFPTLRDDVDEQLRQIVLDDRWGFGVPAIEVSGPPAERVSQVLARVATRRG